MERPNRPPAVAVAGPPLPETNPLAVVGKPGLADAALPAREILGAVRSIGSLPA